MKKLYNYIGDTMLVNSDKILKDANLKNYAIPQFNINNLEWAKYILEECEVNKSNVILGVSLNAIKYMGGYNVVVSLIKSLISDLNITIDVSLHLDHADSFIACKKAIDAGFTSVMIDASKYNINENIKIVKEVKEYAKKYNVTVEAEIGYIGNNDNIEYASVSDSELLVKETNIDLLAPSLGNIHGIYKNKPNLNFDLIKEIKDKTNIPLVLHGGSGLSESDIKKSISCGINKININTDLQIAFSNGLKEAFTKNKNEYEFRTIMKFVEKNIKETVRNKIILFGSATIK